MMVHVEVLRTQTVGDSMWLQAKRFVNRFVDKDIVSISHSVDTGQLVVAVWYRDDRVAGGKAR